MVVAMEDTVAMVVTRDMITTRDMAHGEDMINMVDMEDTVVSLISALFEATCPMIWRNPCHQSGSPIFCNFDFNLRNVT